MVYKIEDINWDEMPEWADVWIEFVESEASHSDWFRLTGAEKTLYVKLGYHPCSIESPRVSKVHYPPIKQWRGTEDYDDCEFIAHPSTLKFRPIKSDRERWLDFVYTIFPDIEDCPKETHLLKLYEAMQSGKLPTPEVKNNG